MLPPIARSELQVCELADFTWVGWLLLINSAAFRTQGLRAQHRRLAPDVPQDLGHAVKWAHPLP